MKSSRRALTCTAPWRPLWVLICGSRTPRLLPFDMPSLHRVLEEERALALSFLGSSRSPDYIHLGTSGFSTLPGAGSDAPGVPAALILASAPALPWCCWLSPAVHLLADTYIGTVTPFYPWDDTWFRYAFNSAFDIRTEVCSSVWPLAVTALRPLEALRSIEASTVGRGALMVTSALCIAMAGLQAVYFLIVSQGPGLDLFRSLLVVRSRRACYFHQPFL